MKFTQDLSPRSFKLFDDQGREIVDAPISRIDIHLRPNMSTAVIYVDFPSLDLEINTDKVTLRRSCRLVPVQTRPENDA